jgi:hypothetical protein
MLIIVISVILGGEELRQRSIIPSSGYPNYSNFKPAGKERFTEFGKYQTRLFVRRYRSIVLSVAKGQN